MKILVLGASGMIGSAIFRVLSCDNTLGVYGSIRSADLKRFFKESQKDRLLVCNDILNQTQLVRLFSEIQPDVVINCVGLTKHHQEAGDALLAIPVNALLPHRLADLCGLIGARLIHISTDCVFTGASTPKGGYCEGDRADAIDLYGRSKILGEVTTYPHAITLRTSTIGHELQSSYGLLEWFLSQRDSCKGFNKAIFSGLPSTVFAEFIRDYIITRPQLHGLYHVGASPIGKHDLLKLIAKVYGKNINIIRDDDFVIDRSLNSQLLSGITGYRAPDWPELIEKMRKSQEA